MANIDVVDKNNIKTGVLELDEKIFNARVNTFILQQVVNMYLANKRKSFAKVKNRAEVRGGGKKPWKQKGTGRARVGSIRSPLWRGGGVVFGPIPKDWHYQVPKKIKSRALISSLSAKFKSGAIIIIDKLDLATHKTRQMADVLKKLKIASEKTLLVTFGSQENLLRSGRNIKNLNITRVEDVNAYDVLINSKLLFEKSAVGKIEKRLGAHSAPDKPKSGTGKKVA